MTTRYVADDETLKYIAELEAYNKTRTDELAGAARRIATLEQQVAALTNERDWLSHKSKCLEMERASQERYLAAAQAREAKLRGHMLNIALACRIWGGEAERARKMLEECLALPTDDSALMERLKQERERCAMVCEEAPYLGNDACECADAIRGLA